MVKDIFSTDQERPPLAHPTLQGTAVSSAQKTLHNSDNDGNDTGARVLGFTPRRLVKSQASL